MEENLFEPESSIDKVEQLLKDKKREKKQKIIDSIEYDQAYFWYQVAKFLTKDKFSQMGQLLDKFYEIKIREFKCDIGASENQGGGKLSSVIGRAMSEPNQAICQLLKDITMYTKFRLLQITHNNTIKPEMLEFKAAQTLMNQCKTYIIRNLERSEMQKSIALSAIKIRFETINDTCSIDIDSDDLEGKNEEQFMENLQIKMKLQDNKLLIFQMIGSLSQIGGQYYSIGQIKDCEQCYLHYIKVMEVVFGESQELASCYFYLSQFYYESYQYVKSQKCLEKVIGIVKEEEKQGEALYNLGMVLRKQMQYQKSLQQIVKAKNIYEKIQGKQSLKYTLCLFEIAKIKFIQKMYDNSYVILTQCLKNYNFLYKNNPNHTQIQKTKLLIKTINKITGEDFKEFDAKKEYKSLVENLTKKLPEKKLEIMPEEKPQQKINENYSEKTNEILKLIQNKVQEKMFDKMSKKERKYLFDVSQHQIALSLQENRVISMICLFFSFDKKQLESLSIVQAGDFLEIKANDETQEKLIQKSEIYQTKIKKNLGELFVQQSNDGKVYPNTIIDFISNINPTLLQKSLDEQNIEQSIIYPLLNFHSFLDVTQQNLLQTLKSYKLPLRYLIFILTNPQKTILLEEAFLKIYENENSHGELLFQMLQLYLGKYKLF